MLQVVWFKRDLRTADHRPLVDAADRGPVLPLYIVEPDLWRQPDSAGRQWAFIAQSLGELRSHLAALGQPLVVRVGDAIDVLDRLRATFGPFHLLSHQETGNGWTYRRDIRVRAWARAWGVAWTEHRQHGVIRGLRTRNGWAREWDRFMRAPAAPAPCGLPPLDGVDVGAIPVPAQLGLTADPCPYLPEGGRSAGAALLQSFLSERGARYHREMSSPNTAYRACSRLSAHFAAGTISIREALHAVLGRIDAVRALPPEARGAWLPALRAFEGRLHWHCHFIQKLEDQPSLEFDNQHRAYDGLREGEFDHIRFEARARGETGLPYVDACMRALRTSGWINFRARAMLAAVAAYHLWLHWREPALHLARLFVDYEPGIHYPQMQMQSGTTGINTVRIYNPVKQSRDHDPNGNFIRKHVAELAGVPGEYIHEPWRLPDAMQRAAGCRIGIDYPQPIVDPIAAARQARDAVWAVRRAAGYREEADAIQDRHGSRKSGLAPSNPSRRTRSKKPSAQLALKLCAEVG